MNLDWFGWLGTAAFSISGYLIGVRKRFDLLGIMILAVLTAIGGGMIRDVLINRLPRVFFDSTPILIIAGSLLVAWLLRLHRQNHTFLFRLFVVADSAGLIAFSLAGAQEALAMHLNLFGVVLLAFITAVGGGIVRDMMVNDVPFILNRDFYGTVAILMALLLALADAMGQMNLSTLWGLFWFGLGLRLVAHAREFRLPKV